MAPHLNEFKGKCSERGSFKLELLTEGFPTAKELRNVTKVLELTATWLDEDSIAVPVTNAAQLWDALQGLRNWCEEGCPDGGRYALTEANAALKMIRPVSNGHRGEGP